MNLFESSPSTLTTPEKHLAAEALVERLVFLANATGQRAGLDSLANRRPGSCNFMPDIVKQLTVEGLVSDEVNIDARIYQVEDIHNYAITMNHEFWRPYIARHGFNIATVEDASFLIDLSYAQFVKPDTRMEEVFGIKGPPLMEHSCFSPLMSILLNKGYVFLGNQAFRDYMRLTTLAPVASYINETTTDVLNCVSESELDIDQTRINYIHNSLPIH